MLPKDVKSDPWFSKAQKAAIRQEWEQADAYMHNCMLAGSEEAANERIAQALQALADDCDKLGLSEVMVWASHWTVRIKPTQPEPYLRLATYHEKQGERQTAIEWLNRGLEMVGGEGDSQLRRVLRRIKRSI